MSTIAPEHDAGTPIWDQVVHEQFGLAPGTELLELLSIATPLVPISEGEVTLAMRTATLVASEHELDQHSDQDQGNPNATNDECANSD